MSLVADSNYCASYKKMIAVFNDRFCLDPIFFQSALWIKTRVQCRHWGFVRCCIPEKNFPCGYFPNSVAFCVAEICCAISALTGNYEADVNTKRSIHRKSVQVSTVYAMRMRNSVVNQ